MAGRGLLSWARQWLAISTLLSASVQAVQPSYGELLFGDRDVPGACCAEEIELRRSFPYLSYEVQATFFANFALRKSEQDQFYATYRSCECETPWKARTGGARVRLGSFDLDLQASETLPPNCTEHHQLPTIVVARQPPIEHYGHQFITVVPALAALKLHLAAAGIDATSFPVLFADMMGPYASTPPNAREMLSALGFNQWIRACPNCKPPSQGDSMAVCVDKAIVISFGYYGVWYVNENGDLNHFWQRPKSMMDTDPILMHVVESVRAHYGLAAELPFAPTDHQVIVVATRSLKHRLREAGKTTMFIHKRILENEDELVAELSKLPNVTVKQVSFGSLRLSEVVETLGSASMLLGYHGSNLENVLFLARGGWLLEIMPSKSNHLPLYSSKAYTTAKFAARYYNNDPARESCDKHNPGCRAHDMNLEVDIPAVVNHVVQILETQKIQFAKVNLDAA